MKLVIYILVVIIALVIPYMLWEASRVFNYKFSYEDMVERTCNRIIDERINYE